MDSACRASAIAPTEICSHRSYSRIAARSRGSACRHCERGYAAACSRPAQLRPRPCLTLRERGFPLEAIARWLDSEGYVAPDRALSEWTHSDFNTLLREARAFAKQTSETSSDEHRSPALL